MHAIPAWSLILLGGAVLAGAITIPLAIRTRRRRTASGEGGAGGGGLVTAAIAVGWIVIVATAVSTILAAIAIGLGAWPVPILTAPYWPELPVPQDRIGGVSFVTGGGYTEASALITDLAPAARIWTVVTAVIQGGAIVVVALVVVRLCRSLRAGRGLAGAGRMFWLLAVLALLGGFAWQIAHQLGGVAAAEQVAPYGLGTALGTHWPTPAGLLTIDVWPVLPFLAFGALAAAFRHAERLQRDTEGLV